MKKIALFIVFATSVLSATAQSDKFKLEAETRIDYQREYLDGEANHAGSGFKGKYLNIKADGKLSDQLSFSYRQRLNRAHKDETFFDATDWLHLDWKAADNWELSAGKQVVGIGGYEYDRAPIDLYVTSEYWNNIPCYQLGVSAAYVLDGDRFVAQLCESPYSRKMTKNNSDMYAYNLMWYGSHGWFNTIYSVNMIEYTPGKFISYIALGHRLECKAWALELDFMNRAAEGQTYLLKDCSVMGELSYHPSDRLNVFAKATYDVNKTSSPADLSVLPGTEVTLLGGGVEYYPIKGDRNLRLHAYGCYAFGQNGNPAGALLDKQSRVDVGLKWKVKIL